MVCASYSEPKWVLVEGVVVQGTGAKTGAGVGRAHSVLLPVPVCIFFFKIMVYLSAHF